LAAEENRTKARMQRRNAMLAWTLPVVILSVLFYLMPRGVDEGSPMLRHMKIMNEAYLELAALVKTGQDLTSAGNRLIESFDRKPVDFPPAHAFAKMWKDSRDLSVRLLGIESARERKAVWLELVASCENCHEKYRSQ